MAKTIFIPEEKIHLIREYFRVGKETNDYYFVFFSGTLFTFFGDRINDAKSLKALTDLLDDRGMNGTADELLANTENVINPDYVAEFMSNIPRSICGRIKGGQVSILNNKFFDVLNSPEYKKLLSMLNSNDITYDTEAGAYPKHVVGTPHSKRDKYYINSGSFYHGTRLSSARDVAMKGIRASEERSTFLNGGIRHGDTVFLSSDFSTACSYAARWTNFTNIKLEDVPVVFEIDANKIDTNKLVIDYDLYNRYGNGTDDKYEKVIDNTGRRGYISAIKMDKSVDIVKDNPKRYNRVGYRGIIRPSAFSKIHVFLDRSQAMSATPEFTYQSPKEFLEAIPKIWQYIQNAYDLDESKEAKPPYEEDEFEIGSEGGNNDYFHVNEGYCVSKLKYTDLSEVGQVECETYFDESEYNEWLADNELTDSKEARVQYYTDEITYEVTYFDKETFHTMETDYTVMYSDLVELFGEKMAQTILTNCMKGGKYTFETFELYSDNTYDLSSPNEVNDIAMKLFPHGEYYKDCRGFILSNGVIVYTPSEHNEICLIPGVESKFQFIEMGNIRLLPNSIDIGAEPTSEQEDVLREVIASYADDELYLDIFTDGGEIGVKYTCPDWRFVMGEIDRYYREGIRPQGRDGMYESKEIKENIESELDQSEVNLSSFKVNDTLAPKLWDGLKLNPKARLRLLDIADDFWETTDVTWVRPKGIILTGSICNFNWSKFSDIDLHIVVDFSEVDERKDFVQEYFNGKKNEWNESHKSLKIYGYPVEVYVEDVDAGTKSGGIYDLEENKWVKEPKQGELKKIGLDKYGIKQLVAKYATKIEDICGKADATDDEHELTEIGKEANKLLNKIKRMRKFGLDRSGESDPFNIAYKCYRRMGYLDMLFDIKSELYDRVKSIGLDESKQMINEFMSTDGNHSLYRYFKYFGEEASPIDKVEATAYALPYAIDEYCKWQSNEFEDFEQLQTEIDENPDNVYEEGFVKKFVAAIAKNNLQDHFLSKVVDLVHYENLPSWYFLTYIRPVKNEWCIHFGADSASISQEGFTNGTYDLDSLAYTNPGSDKGEAGYDFAFLIGDRDVDHNDYGEEAVIFRTSGVLCYHHGDQQRQVIFWGPSVKEFIPITYDGSEGDWVVRGMQNQILKMGSPSEIAVWATDNLPQYRKQIQTGKNGYIPKMYDYTTKKAIPTKLFRNESVQKYLTLLKENIEDEEIVADGNADRNVYAKRWRRERELLKRYVLNYGTLMTSKENGKTYKVVYDSFLSTRIGINYCICLQYDQYTGVEGNTLYVRAMDKFTQRMFHPEFDTRGYDNETGTSDDILMQNV